MHAHHVDAALAASMALGKAGWLYHAHASMRQELPGYLGLLPRERSERIGAWLDDVRHRAPGTLVFTPGDAASPLGRTRVAPPVIPSSERRRATAWRTSKRVRGLAVYLGNADPYQNLAPLLQAAAGWRGEWRLRWVTHQPPCSRYRALVEQASGRIELCVVPDLGRALRLAAEAHVAVVPRSQAHGFPYKMLVHALLDQPIASRLRWPYLRTTAVHDWACLPELAPANEPQGSLPELERMSNQGMREILYMYDDISDSTEYSRILDMSRSLAGGSVSALAAGRLS